MSAYKRALLSLNSIGQPTVYSAIVCFLSAIEKPRITREITNSMYAPSSYIIATASMQLLMMLVLAAWIVVLTYAWYAYNWVGFPTSWGIQVVNLFYWNNLAQLLGWCLGLVLGPSMIGALWALFFGACSARAPAAACTVLKTVQNRSDPFLTASTHLSLCARSHVWHLLQRA